MINKQFNYFLLFGKMKILSKIKPKATLTPGIFFWRALIA